MRQREPEALLGFSSLPTRADAEAVGVPWDVCVEEFDLGLPQVYTPAQRELLLEDPSPVVAGNLNLELRHVEWPSGRDIAEQVRGAETVQTGGRSQPRPGDNRGAARGRPALEIRRIIEGVGGGAGAAGTAHEHRVEPEDRTRTAVPDPGGRSGDCELGGHREHHHPFSRLRSTVASIVRHGGGVQTEIAGSAYGRHALPASDEVG